MLLGFIDLNGLKSGSLTPLPLCKHLFQVQFLQDIGVRSDAIGNVLVKFPPVLTYSLYKKIRPVVCSHILLLFILASASYYSFWLLQLLLQFVLFLQYLVFSRKLCTKISFSPFLFLCT